ncbi:MAG: hypothetical protein K2F99_09615 [Muribaculaceae bacterium]|nr:hypothetical protein [Muribaculaceae bacterium]
MIYNMFELTELDGHKTIRWCPGDFLRWTSTKDRREIRSRLNECRVSADPGLETLLDKCSILEVYRAIATISEQSSQAAVRKVVTPWYTSRALVDRHLDDLGYKYTLVEFGHGTIYLRLVQPLTLPHQVIVYAGNGNKLYTKIELHPELTGVEDAKGTTFFPDKTSRRSICPGPAIVNSVYMRNGMNFGHISMAQ